MALQKEFKTSQGLIEIYHGTLPGVFVSTTQSRVVRRNKVFLPDPAIEVSLPAQTGVMDEEPCEVTFRRFSRHPGLAALVERMASPAAMADCRIVISNLISSGPEDVKEVFLYDGILERTSRSPKGVGGTVKAFFLPEHILNLEDSPLGVRADATCGHVWGSTGCGVDYSRFFDGSTYFPSHSAQVRKAHVIGTLFPSSTSRVITLSLDPAFHPGADQRTLTAQPKGWWVRGWLEKDGLRIMVADWRYNSTLGTGTNLFILSRVPPLDWDLGKMVLVPGCQRTVEACALRQNSVNFGGYGHGIPTYNPTTEVSDA